MAYFEAHPEQASQAPDAREHIEALLVENPALRDTDLARRASCSEGTASRWRDTYFQEHPEKLALAGD